MMHPKQSVVQKILGGRPPEPNGAAAESGGTAPRGPSVVQRHLGNGANGSAESNETKPPEEELLERMSYCLLRGRLPLPPMFRLINRQGRWRSFDYASLTGASMDGPDRLLLHYEGRECYTLILTGIDLDQELADAFDERRVKWVRELEVLQAQQVHQQHPGQAVVTSIRIDQGMVSRGWEAEPGSRKAGLPASRRRGEKA
jgi:hypothetical protein